MRYCVMKTLPSLHNRIFSVKKRIDIAIPSRLKIVYVELYGGV